MVGGVTVGWLGGACCSRRRKLRQALRSETRDGMSVEGDWTDRG